MHTEINQFNALHQQDEPLLLGNIWNVQSAKVLEKLNFKAIATSSAAVAETLGYKDGEEMPFEEYFAIIRRIKDSTPLLLSVDLEAGYGKTAEDIIENIKRLHDLGVVGINLEDSIVKNSVREIMDSKNFTTRLERIMNYLIAQHVNIFVNVRCDAFLLNLPDARKEAVERINVYEKTGVHGIFLPCIKHPEDIKVAARSTELPLNVMCIPGLPDFEMLKSLGVKRISMGNFLNSSVYKCMEALCRNIVSEKNFAGLF